jgi:hypothetical protein
MKKIEVYQSLWGMTDLPSREIPWSTEEQIEIIKQAGFDGALQFVDDDLEETIALSQWIIECGLKLGISCVGYELEDIKQKLEYAKVYKAEFVNIMVKDYYKIGSEATLFLEQVIQLGKSIGVSTYIETHRGTVTQDLIRTVDYIKSLPEMELTIDFSHYIVSGEVNITDEKIESSFDELLKKASAIHIRVSNGEQVQVPIHSLTKEQYDNFIRWWKKGIDYAQSRSIVPKPFPIVVELGPELYQQKIKMDDGSWIYDCDRWKEALLWLEIVQNL